MRKNLNVVDLKLTPYKIFLMDSSNWRYQGRRKEKLTTVIMHPIQNLIFHCGMMVPNRIVPTVSCLNLSLKICWIVLKMQFLRRTSGMKTKLVA
jgi:hypothetical protein